VSICFLPYVHDQVRDIWMVPGAACDDPDRFELSVSNANGADLLCTLGLAPEPGGGPVPIEHFAGHCHVNRLWQSGWRPARLAA
jgi:hypothetical protein